MADDVELELVAAGGEYHKDCEMELKDEILRARIERIVRTYLGAV